jgi:4-hydroxy-3-methylbut-2-enyl diphosphate reductase
MLDRHRSADIESRYQAFDTICSATQDRQDAVVALLRERAVDLMLVIGGYNSSNTTHLAALAARSIPSYHIEDASCIEPGGSLRHKPYGAGAETTTGSWLPAGPVTIGLTAGASTPNNKIGEVVAAVASVRGLPLD